MQYQLRTTFQFRAGSPIVPEEIGRADSLLRWLYETLPVRANLGADVAIPQWLGNRYTEPVVVFELITHYRDVFALTADQLRISKAMADMKKRFDWLTTPEADFGTGFVVRRVYGDAELVDVADPTKKLSHPC